tara:strand:+ start:1897 stop:2064 length:168 start_codon:yes stop_codon:yes gene_type:complete
MKHVISMHKESPTPLQKHKEEQREEILRRYEAMPVALQSSLKDLLHEMNCADRTM